MCFFSCHDCHHLPEIVFVPCARICLRLRRLFSVLFPVCGSVPSCAVPLLSMVVLSFFCVPLNALARSKCLLCPSTHANPSPVPLSLFGLFCGCLCAGFVPPYPSRPPILLHLNMPSDSPSYPMGTPQILICGERRKRGYSLEKRGFSTCSEPLPTT